VFPEESVPGVAVVLDLGRRGGVAAEVTGGAVIVTSIFASLAQVCELMKRVVVGAVAVFSCG